MSAIFRQYDDSSESDLGIVYRVEAAGSDREEVVDDYDVFGIGGIMFVEFHVERNLMFSGHCMYSDVVSAGAFSCCCCSDNFHAIK